MIKKIIVGLLTATVVFAAGEARFPKGIIGNLQGTATSITGTLIPGNVPNNFITNSQLQNAPAHTFKGNNTGSSGSPQDLTDTQATAELNTFVGDSGAGGLKGLVPAPAPGDAIKCLGGNGSWNTCGGGGGGSGTASKYEQLEQKSELEHYNLQTDPLDQSLGSGFQTPPGSYPIQGVLMDSVTAGAGTIIPVYNPIPLVPGDANLDSATGWAALVGTSSVATDATHKLGTNSLKFTENSGQPRASIFYDHGAETLNVNGFSDHYVWVNLSSATGVTAIRIQIGDIGGTSSICVSCWQNWDVTTQENGSPLQTGWNLIRQDVRHGGFASGGGWPSTRPFRYYAIGPETPGGASTPVVRIDGPYFSIDDALKYIPKGAEMSLYDGTHRENTVLAAANNKVTGVIAALNNFVQSYAGGIGGATLSRSTLAIGSNQAAMTTTDQFSNAVTGDATVTQESRISKIFRSALSSVDLHASFDVYTPQIYRVGSTTGSSIFIDDPADTHLDLKNGETVHVFSTNYSDGKPYFSHRCDVVQTADSQVVLTGSTTALVAAPCAGLQAGDYVAKQHLKADFNIGSIGTNETFSSPFSSMGSPDDVLLYDDGLPIPNPQNVVAYYSLGFPFPAKDQFGVLPDLTLNGILTNTAPFKNGQFGTMGWSSSNYYVASGSAATVGAISTGFMSAWFYYSTSGHQSYIAGTYNAGASLGLYLATSASNTMQAIVTGYSTTAGALNVGGWNHALMQWDNGGTLELYLNNVLVGSVALAGANTSALDFAVGFNTNIPLAASSTDIIAQVLLERGAKLTETQRSQVYNSGLAKVLGFGPKLKYRAAALGSSGQACTLKGQLKRDTLNVQPSILKMGISP